jgi:hypothetical protein
MIADALKIITRLAQTSTTASQNNTLSDFNVLAMLRYLSLPVVTRRRALAMAGKPVKRSTVISRTWVETLVSRAWMARVPSDQFPTASPI